MSSSPLMVMPAIFRFQLDDHPEESTWGWHRSCDLFEAVNNTLALQGRGSLSAQEFDKRFASFFDPVQDGQSQYLIVTSHRQRLMACRIGGNSLFIDKHIKEGDYLPARCGTKILSSLLPTSWLGRLTRKGA